MFPEFFTQLFCISNPASLRDTFPVRPWQLWEWRGEGAVGPLVSAAQGGGTKGRKIGVDKETECQNTEICRGKHTHKNWMLEWGCKLRFMHFFHNFIWSVCLIADKTQISDSTRSVYLTMTLEQLNVAQTLQMFPYFITELCFSVVFRVRHTPAVVFLVKTSMTRTTWVLVAFLYCAFCFSWHLILESLTSAVFTDFKIFVMFSWGWHMDYVTGGLERHLTPGTNQTSTATGKNGGKNNI